MNESTKIALSILRHATQNGLPIVQASKELGYSRDVVSKTIKRLERNIPTGKATRSEYNALTEARTEFEQTISRTVNNKIPSIGNARRRTKGEGNILIPTLNTNPLNLSRAEVEEIEYDANVDKAYDERSKGETLRGKETVTDGSGVKLKKITGYKYKILIRDERPLEGTLTREQMDAVYRLYSGMDGAGMTLRAVSREFPDLSYKDFKRILRAFNVTKASLPVSPHIMEEMSTDEIVSLIHRNKEHTILKRVDNEKHKYYEKRYFDSQKEINDIKAEFHWVDSVLDSFFDNDKITELFKNHAKNVSDKKRKTKSAKSNKKSTEAIGKPVVCIFGDVHYGKKFDSPIFGRGYNRDIAHERVMKIAEEAVLEVKRKNSNELIMLSMGDILESSMEEGIHAGHFSEMDLHQAEQIFFAVESMIKMIEYVINNTEVKVTFASIHGNHDRMAMGRDEDKSRTGGKIVSGFVERMVEMKHPKRINFMIPDNNLFKMVVGNLCLFAQHGDSGLSKKKPTELLTLFGEGRECYNVFFKGHWHYLKTEEGTNTLAIQVPAVTSTDKYILEEVGSNCLPGFLIGSEPEQGRGFDFKKITLY
jgi:DNA-binding Lrp family transcriptional regulator